MQELTTTADAYFDALQETCRADKHAFGLHEAAREAGDRLTAAMQALAASGVAGLEGRTGTFFDDPGEAFVADLTRAVAGDGGTLTDATVRRAAAKTGGLLLRHYPQVVGARSDADDASSGREVFGELLCFLYRTFFAEFVAEFLRAVVAEHIRLAVPVLAVDPSPDPFVERIAARVVELVPDPCTEQIGYVPAAVDAGSALAGEENVAALPLPDVARRLVPRTVRTILGLAQSAEEEVAA